MRASFSGNIVCELAPNDPRTAADNWTAADELFVALLESE
jgi:hypothetical protein